MQQFVDPVEAIDFAELVFENALVVLAVHDTDACGHIVFGRAGIDAIFECLLLIAGQFRRPTRARRIDQGVQAVDRPVRPRYLSHHGHIDYYASSAQDALTNEPMRAKSFDSPRPKR